MWTEIYSHLCRKNEITISLSRSLAMMMKEVIQIPWEKFQPGRRKSKRLNPEIEKCSASWHLIHKFWLSTLFIKLISFWRISTQIKLSSKNGLRWFFSSIFAIFIFIGFTKKLEYNLKENKIDSIVSWPW